MNCSNTVGRKKIPMEDCMKKKLLIMTAFAFLAAGLFAAGAQENPLGQYQDKVTLTGTLQFTDGYPELNVGGKAYAVMAPGLMRDARLLKAGIKMTVEGYKIQPGPRSARPKVEHVLAQKVTIDGKVFDLSQYGPYGRGGRMMGGAGRGSRGGCWDDGSWGPGQGRGRWDDERRPGPGGRGR